MKYIIGNTNYGRKNGYKKTYHPNDTNKCNQLMMYFYSYAYCDSLKTRENFTILKLLEELAKPRNLKNIKVGRTHFKMINFYFSQEFWLYSQLKCIIRICA